MHILSFLLPLAVLRVPGPLSPRNANYQIEASLDAAQKTVRGKETIEWRNPSTVPAGELVLHLYMNAFKNDESTFFRESHGRHRGNHSEPHGWGEITVAHLRVDGVERPLKVNDTLGTVSLAAPIPPGGTAHIEVEFTTKLPRVFARTGWAKDFFAIGQWFPKVAVFDGKWRAHQLHLNSEFFADFGVYDVRVDVPKGFVVGGVGRVERTWDEKDRTFLQFHAEDVTDFSWFASPKFLVRTDHYDDVELRLLLWPGHESAAVRHFAAAKAGLTQLERVLGKYPYTQITIVDVPDDAEGAGGMEYPTLFTTMSFPAPEGVHVDAWVTTHELSHQYFQGIVASDEAEEAWLDEGLTETMTDWNLSKQFGKPGALYDFLGHRMSYVDASRLGYRERPDVDPPETFSFDFVDNQTYNVMTYSKTDLILRTAEGLVGRDKVEAGLHHYYEQAKFTHPRRADFVRLFDEGAGVDLTRFWHDTLEGSELVDYEILDVKAEPVRAPAGIFNGVEVSPSPSPKAPWRSEVVVHRKGTIALPVDVRVVFEDKSERHERWDDAPGKKRWQRYEYRTPTAVAFAEVDPEHKLALDVSRLDDGMRRKPDPEPRRRILGGWQRWLSIALAAVGF